MGLIKEPIEVDFFVEPQPLSDTERKAVSAFIKAYKERVSYQKQQKVTVKKEELMSPI